MDEISRAFVYTYKGQNLLSYDKMSFGWKNISAL